MRGLPPDEERCLARLPIAPGRELQCARERGHSGTHRTRTGERLPAHRPTDTGEPRDQRLFVRVSKSEKVAIADLAERAGLDVSEYLRERALASEGE